ncbi:MoxR family ATPase [Longimicrobium sp.]|uniref:AAA family ATPase n=1 Tax=Longimicrobium sp. TaxID=2029185 RepID=UPI002E34B3EB|nr:MoxR family ATPase [Longimicrobium sp.]HEX6040970.1 MoxR family ATPase [Longimicrobium sp.]
MSQPSPSPFAPPDAPPRAEFLQHVATQVHRRVVGQDYMVERLLIGLLTGGHVLMEGLPGLAKTLAVRTLADSIDASFARVQFTPDLLPADVVGTTIYNQRTGEFVPHRGPIFAHIVLADEVNRAPAKVQAALLEAMQERQVTIGGETYPLPRPFLVLATQNPIEQVGTYPLPEAQVDRFMLKVRVGYPTRDEEKEILRRMGGGGDDIPVRPVATPADILQAREQIAGLYLDDRIADYILDLVHATREPKKYGAADLAPLIEYGASPRATLALAACSRAHAYLRGRGYVVPEDVKAIAPDVLRHRILTSYEAEAEQVTPDDVVRRVLKAVRVP